MEELIRVFLSKSTDEAMLIIHSHHLAGDEKSILLFINDILDCLSGQKLTFKPMILINQKRLKKRAKLPLGIKLVVADWNRKWKKQGRNFSWDDYEQIHEKYWREHTSDFEITTYNATELKRNCPTGITLNSFLVTKLLSEYPKAGNFGIPVSIRENNGSMSNQTSGIAVKYQYSKEISFEDNLREVHSLIYDKLKKPNERYNVLLF